MVPTDFPESNCLFNVPEGFDPDEVEPISGASIDFEGYHELQVTCWKVTAEELAEINKTKRVWLVVHGENMPFVSVVGTNPFTNPEKTNEKSSG